MNPFIKNYLLIFCTNIVIGLFFLSGTASVSNPAITYGVACEANKAKRQTMQDEHLAGDGLFIICDGHGGPYLLTSVYETNEFKKLKEQYPPLWEEGIGYHTYRQETFIDAGRIAAHLAAKTIAHAIQKDQTASPEKMPFIINNAFQTAEKTLATLGCDSHGITYHAGTTALVMTIDTNNVATIGWVGDSRAVIVNQQGTIIWKSQDHKPGIPYETKRITEALHRYQGNELSEVKLVQGIPRIVTNNTYGLAISRALGDFGAKYDSKNIYFGGLTAAPQIVQVQLKKGDTIIMACDGIWDELSSQEAAELIQQNAHPSEAAQQLINYALQRNKHCPHGDNMTAIVVNTLENSCNLQNNVSSFLKSEHDFAN